MTEAPSDGIDASVEEAQADADARRRAGEFVRGRSGFRRAIGVDPDYPAAPGRGRLYVALNCPWCHRVTLARSVLGLTQSISMDVAFPTRTLDDDPEGPGFWEFNPERLSSLDGQTLPECTSETATGKALRLAIFIYQEEGSSEKSLPILFDKKSQRIVSNESAEIVRMLGRNAEALGSVMPAADRPQLYPPGANNAALRADIDALNEAIYVNINNGAYKAGFSSDQSVYRDAFGRYFDELARLDARLAAHGKAYLTGDTFTEADLRLYPTLYRHDPVYYIRMKLNGAKILDYPHVWRWLCRVYALPGVAESGSLQHCRQGYFGRSWNNVIPLGPFAPMAYPEAYRHPELAREPSSQR